MPSDELLRIEGAEALRRLARDLREFEDGRELAKRLRRELKRTGDRIAQAEKAAVLGLPSKGQNARRGRRSLRAGMARATQVRVRTTGRQAGVVVWVNPKRMPEGQRNLPGYVEGEPPFQRWRHPTFGSWEKAVTQPPSPYFYRTARPYEADAQRDAQRAIDEIADEIERRH